MTPPICFDICPTRIGAPDFPFCVIARRHSRRGNLQLKYRNITTDEHCVFWIFDVKQNCRQYTKEPLNKSPAAAVDLNRGSIIGEEIATAPLGPRNDTEFGRRNADLR